MDKLLVEVHKAKEGLDLLDLCWGQPLCNSVDLCQIHSNVVFQDDQSKVFDLLLLELAFLWLEKQPLPSEGGKDLADNLPVFGEGGGVDEDVVHMLLNPQRRSSTVKNSAPWRWVRTLETRGRG